MGTLYLPACTYLHLHLHRHRAFPCIVTSSVTSSTLKSTLYTLPRFNFLQPYFNLTWVTTFLIASPELSESPSHGTQQAPFVSRVSIEVVTAAVVLTCPVNKYHVHHVDPSSQAKACRRCERGPQEAIPVTSHQAARPTRWHARIQNHHLHHSQWQPQQQQQQDAGCCCCCCRHG